MQYKGFKQVKRMAAVILSAAIILTDVPGVSAAEYRQDLETEALEETTKNAVTEDTAPEENTLKDEASGDEVSENETPEDTEQAASDFSDASENVETKETETENTETENAAQAAAEESETQTEETTEITKTKETEITETEETQITETPQSVPVPEIDDSVYESEKTDYTYIDNASAFASYNVEGTLEQNQQGEYVIKNKDQFLIFLASNTDYSDSVVRLECDVDMKGETAQFSKTFEGKFDGNGHSIYNYKANGALFKGIGVNGEVTGLHLSQVAFLQEQAAAALAVKNDGKVSNVTVHTDIKVTKDMATAAGIVLENSGEISGCAFAGNITADSGTDNIGKAVGGIVSSNMGRVANCHTLGSIQTNGTEIGGIAARSSKTIENCTSHMDIKGAYCIGGIAAENTGTVSGCSNYGAVTQNSSSDEGLAGGIAAKSTDKISDCENYAEISGEYKNIGGIAGYSAGDITKCGNYGAVSGSENIGGIAGLISGTNRIQGSFNRGRIGVKINGNSQGIGGILGAAARNAEVIIENCYNRAAINGAGAKYIGGIAGVLYKGSIKNAYNTEAVSASAATEESPSYAAAIAGFMGVEEDAECAGCLILEGIGDVLYYRQTGAVKADEEKATSAELKSASVLSLMGDGFASDNNSINDGYPIIKEQHASSHKCVVVYEPNGGCADDYFDIVEQGASVSKPDSPIKKSASFLGWFIDKACTAEYSFSGSAAQSMVLYAGWESGKLAEDITLAQKEVTLVKGETFTLKDKVQFEPASAENRTLVFISGDSSIAEVNEEGVITAVREGETTISIKLADDSLDKTLAFKVIVSDKSNIVRFRIYNDKGSTAEFTRLSIAVNDPVVVEAVYGVKPPEGSTVKWSSVSPDYVKAEAQSDLAYGHAAKLEALKPTTGLQENSVEILCTLIYPDKQTFTSYLKVTVKPLAERVSVQAGREDATDKTVIYDIGTKKFIAVGDTKLSEPTDTLSAAVAPSDASQKVKWSSSDSYVLKFDDEESGKADSRAVGEVTVTASATDGSKDKNGKTISGKATVKVRRIIQELSFTPKPMDGNGSVSVDKNGRIEIAEGSSIKLVPTYNPVDATEKKLKWTNGNKNAIELTKVEEGTNVLVVTAKKVAQDTVVKLRADAMDMGGAFYEMELVIKPKVETIKIYRTDDVDRDSNLSGKNIGIDPERDSMTFSLMAVNEPSNASQMVTWKISNTKVADFKDNEDGTCTVQVKAMGTAAITATATDGSKTTATTTLNVASLVSSVEIEGSNMLVKGKTIQLKATVYPKSATNKTFKWVSLYPDIASVNPNTGEVRGVKEGFAIIRATAADGSGKSGEHAVWVKDPVEDFDIMVPDGDDNIKNDVLLTGKMLGLDPDNNKGAFTVAARILPDTACQEVEWKSSNEKVATVEPSDDSKTCIITAKTLGKTTITMSSIDGSGRKASVTVNISTLVTNIKITGGHYVGIDKELQLKAEVGDKDATSKAVIWKSDNPRAATVDKYGLVTGIRDGDADISAEAADGSGVIAKHRVYVIKEKNDVSISAYSNCEIYTKNKKKYIIKDKDDPKSNIDISNRKEYELRLKAELSNGSSIRDGVPMDVNWSSSDKSIAAVEPEEGNSSIGIVTIRKAGTVTLTAMTAEGYEKSESVTMTVTNINPYVEITGSGHRLGSGKSMKLSAGNVPVTWQSDNEQIAKVNKSGRVTACKGAVGTANIIATSLDGIGGKNSDSYTLHVSDPVQQVDITLNGNPVTGEKLGIDLMKGYQNNSSIQLEALLDGAKAGEDVVWKSSNKNIAERDEYGYVDFKKNGTVTFTATAGDGSKKKAKVTFVVAKQIVSMEAANQNIYLGLKKSVQLEVIYKPLACTIKKAVWESSDPSVVSVNKNTGKVTGKAIGSAVITAMALYDSGISCSFYVTVSPAVNKVEIISSNMPAAQYQDVIGIDLSTAVNTAALRADLYTKVGKEYESIGSQRVQWSSSNKKIAEVDENGVVTAIKGGEVTITATALDGSKKSGKVKIYIGKLITSLTPSDEIKDGIILNLRSRKTMELAGKFTALPITATNQAYTYTTSNKKIVTVNAKGKVTGKKAGDAKITITPKDGSGCIITIPVTVE